MDVQEYSRIPEVQEQEAAEALSEMFVHAKEGDRVKNIRAICASLAVRYLEDLQNRVPISESINSDCLRDAKTIRNRYDGLPRELTDGVQVEGEVLKPAEDWLASQAIKMKNFEKSSKILSTLTQANVPNIAIDILFSLESKTNPGVNAYRKSITIGEAATKSQMRLEDLKLIATEMKGLMNLQKEEEIKKNENLNNDERRTKSEIDEHLTFLTENCVEYAMLTFTSKAINQVRRYIHSSLAVEVMEYMDKEFRSLGSRVTSSPYYQESPDFMNDMINLLNQDTNLGIIDLAMLARTLESSH